MAEQKAKKNTHHEAAQPGRQSAPELPTHVAKEYGLHHIVAEAENKASTKKNQASDGVAVPEDQGVAPVVTDPKTDAAVDDIIAKEGDELLAVQDAIAGATTLPVKPRGFWGKIGHGLKVWVTNPWARWITIVIVFAAAMTITLVPKARYFVLNSVGVRSSVGIKILDRSTQLPLKNVTVRVDGREAKTDIRGEARLTNVRLGSQKLTIRRIAFETITRDVTIGWGSNPLGTMALKAAGLSYSIMVRDFVSDKPLAGVEARSTDQTINALSDKNGLITLTVSDTDPKEITVTIAKKGFRSEALALNPGRVNDNSAKLVPSAKTFYISNASGRYDLYASDIDGRGKKVILNGTGNETANTGMALAPSPSAEWVAYVSTRDGARSRDGYLLRGITLVKYDGSAATTLERVEQIRLIDWVGSRIIYQVTVAGASAANSQRNRLISYDSATNSRVQLATTNHFTGIHSIQGVIYYATGAADPSSEPAFMRIRPDGTNRQTIFKQEIWTVLRTSHTTLALQSKDGWRSYTAGAELRRLEGAPSSTSRRYADSPDGTRAATVETRDGKAAVMVASLRGGADKKVTTMEGATTPLRWLNDTTILFRVVTETETADYAVSTLGGSPRKVVDLTNTFGLSPL